MKLQVKCEIEIPDDPGITDDHIYEWLNHYLCHAAVLHRNNPLFDTELEAKWGTVDWNER